MTANLSSTTPENEKVNITNASDDHLQVVGQECVVQTAAPEEPAGQPSDDVKPMQEIVRMQGEIDNYEAVLKTLKDEIKALNQKVKDCVEVNHDLKNRLSDSNSSLDASQREIKKLTCEVEHLQSPKHDSADVSGNSGGGGEADEPRPVAHVSVAKKLG